MRYASTVRTLLFSFVLLVLSQASFGQVAVSVSFGPPPIPVYEQPVCPGDGYLWTPGYWAYDDEDGYYWVPGTWVEAPEPGYLWTPGYWGWGGSAFLWHPGYWGPHVGFYGGINYGHGYFGNGFEGGRWQNNRFYYNTAVVHVNETIIHNTYRTTVIENNRSRVAYNGGQGGLNYRATPQQESWTRERHVEAVSAQREHREAARGNPQLRASANQGRPPIAATARANDFHGGTVAAREAGGAYHAPPPNAARGNQGNPAGNQRPTNDTRKAQYNHANEVQQHQYTPPNTGNPKLDQKYQQQQQKLAAKQNEQHVKLQQQQEKQHQQLERRQANDVQKQKVEQRHTQQTQQLEQKHVTQQQHMQQRQTPRQAPPRPQGGGQPQPHKP